MRTLNDYDYSREKFGCETYLTTTFPMYTKLVAFFLIFGPVWVLEYGVIADHLDYTYNETHEELKKRGFHEEPPLIYIADDHPLEHYWLAPYYPSRSFHRNTLIFLTTNIQRLEEELKISGKTPTTRPENL